MIKERIMRKISKCYRKGHQNSKKKSMEVYIYTSQLKKNFKVGKCSEVAYGSVGWTQKIAKNQALHSIAVAYLKHK